MGAGRRRCATSRPHHTVSLERGRVIEELAGTVLQHAQNAVMAVDDDVRVGVYNPAAAPRHAARSRCRRPPASARSATPVSYTHLRAHETDSYLVCRLLLE